MFIKFHLVKSMKKIIPKFSNNDINKTSILDSYQYCFKKYFCTEQTMRTRL